jgi:PAS domain-containing protein
MIAALNFGMPVHNRFWLKGLDNKHRHIEGTAIPLVNVEGENLGAVGFFWELVGGETQLGQPSADPEDSRHHAVETILTRRLASRLATPIFQVDAAGRLIYFNGAAGDVLGSSFEEVAAMNRHELYAAFDPTCEGDEPIPMEEHPMSIARLSQEPVHRRVRIVDLDGERRLIEVTAIPLIGQCGRMLGAFGFFWEIEQP